MKRYKIIYAVAALAAVTAMSPAQRSDINSGDLGREYRDGHEAHDADNDPQMTGSDTVKTTAPDAGSDKLDRKNKSEASQENREDKPGAIVTPNAGDLPRESTDGHEGN